MPIELADAYRIIRGAFGERTPAWDQDCCRRL
jgi:hypothetical protein